MDKGECECHSKGEIHYAQNEASNLNVKYGGLVEDLVSEPGWRGAVRRGIDSAGKVKPVCSLQPTTFSLQSLRHLFWETMWVLLSAKNGGGKMGLSCSESCTGRDHLSA